ncbi:hypothetical protein [Paraliomyxa miuraensis]|uniref:hypothetical protein n=1 Tax=Paraliomyxa miuraensis TaxID=376150 RepID=UPI00224F1B96|nr:hypothetical protein [Paraliomyxa miuraensis]MCX4245946.1 hypothetical protein [Paraliomyxa miuraensis]
MTAARHLRLSLAIVALFLAMGVGLEAMLGLRVRAWFDDPLRRELLRLGHAHGALLGLVNVALGWAMERLSTPPPWATRIRLAALLGAVAVGLGFVGGGLWHAPTDPGPLVLLVPAGALLMVSSLVAVVLLPPRDAEPGPKS